MKCLLHEAVLEARIINALKAEKAIPFDDLPNVLHRSLEPGQGFTKAKYIRALEELLDDYRVDMDGDGCYILGEVETTT